MAATKVIIYIEKIRDTDRFRIVRVKNALIPSVGEIIDSTRAQALINAGKEVIVDLPRSRD